mgnify:FL=1
MKVFISGFPKHRWYHNWLFEKFGYENKQKVYVKIDDYDTWNMDTTLAYIIVPMLKQLRNQKHGNPIVDMEDRPGHLIGTIPKGYDVDEFHFEAWDWVLGEMLFAFESKHDDWEDQFQSGEVDRVFIDREDGLVEWAEGPNHTFDVDMEGRMAYQKRVSNGFRLFGKYYECLWD